MQILTPDFSGRRPPPLPSAPLPSSPLPSPLSPPHLPSPPPCLPPTFPPSLPPPSSQVRLRPVVALWHAVSVAYLAAALAHSHCLTVSLSHCLSLSLSHLSHLSHLFLISLSSLSLSPLCLSSFRLSSLSSLAGGSGQRATYKGLFAPASKKSAVFFPTSLPSTFPFWSASFRPPPWPQVLLLYFNVWVCI